MTVQCVVLLRDGLISGRVLKGQYGGGVIQIPLEWDKRTTSVAPKSQSAQVMRHT